MDFLCSPQGQELVRQYENRRQKAKKLSDKVTLIVLLNGHMDFLLIVLYIVCSLYVVKLWLHPQNRCKLACPASVRMHLF